MHVYIYIYIYIYICIYTNGDKYLAVATPSFTRFYVYICIYTHKYINLKFFSQVTRSVKGLQARRDWYPHLLGSSALAPRFGWWARG